MADSADTANGSEKPIARPINDSHSLYPTLAGLDIENSFECAGKAACRELGLHVRLVAHLKLLQCRIFGPSHAVERT